MKTPEDPTVRTTCTDITYSRRERALYVHLFIAILPLTLGGYEWTNLLLVGLLVGYTVTGLFLTRRYNALPASEQKALRGAEHLYVQVGLLGLIYNAIFIHLATQNVADAMEHLLLISALLCAGGAGVYQHLRGLAFTFILSAVAPQVLYYLVVGETMTALLLVVFLFFMSETSFALHRDAIERLRLTVLLAQSKQAAEHLSRTDPLTGLHNRRAFAEFGDTLFAVAERHDQPLTVMMIDIDHFKEVNDRFGHTTGDSALAQVAQIIQAQSRGADVASRFGGEEFVVLMPNTDAHSAYDAAERLRRAIERVELCDSEPFSLTVSIGVSATANGDESLADAVERADGALYEAKKLGRNRTVARRKRIGNVVHLDLQRRARNQL